MNLTNETLTTQKEKYTAFWYTPKDSRRDMTKDVEASLNNNEKNNNNTVKNFVVYTLIFFLLFTLANVGLTPSWDIQPKCPWVRCL